MGELPLNNLEASIIMILEEHPGKEEAISRKDLVAMVCDLEGFEICERLVRSTIKHLVEQHGAWIGSCSKGYFMIETEQELRDACKYYHGYALSLLHIEARLKKTSLPVLVGQISMELGG